MADTPRRILSYEEGAAEDRHRGLFLTTPRGRVEARYYPAPGARAAVLWLGGVGGGFDSPARGLYPELAHALAAAGIASLRVRYRSPGDLAESTEDALAGAEFLRSQGARALAAVGHSFGGAIALRAAAADPGVVAVAGLASQSYGTDEAVELRDRALLLYHGTEDTVLPPECSLAIKARAPGAEVILYKGAGHSLEEAADDLRGRLLVWLRQALTPRDALA
jgi:hypothetical protein